MRRQNFPHPFLSHVFPLQKPMAITWVCIYSLHPEISIHILQSVLTAFWNVLTRRICLKVKSFFCCWSFSLFSWPQCVILRWYCKEKLDASQSLEGKGLILINPSEWRGELREKFFFCFLFFDFFFQRITMLQSSTLSYECDQSQSTSHILVCPGFRSRFSGLLTRLTLWS